MRAETRKLHSLKYGSTIVMIMTAPRTLPKIRVNILKETDENVSVGS